MLSDVLLHPTDTKLLQDYCHDPNGAILLVAANGFGLTTLAKAMAGEMVPKKATDTFVIELKPNDKKAITVEMARQVKDFFKLRTLQAGDKRVVIIHNADTMTTEAQNALLKILEEPPVDCYFVLTSSLPDTLLTTMLSRVWRYELKVPSAKQIEDYFVRMGFSSLEIGKVTPLSGNLPELTGALLNGEANELTATIAVAKDLLAKPVFEKLCIAEPYTKDRQQALVLVESLLKITHAALASSLAKEKPSNNWQRIAKELLNAKSLLEQNVQTKLVLTDLMLSM